jgi:hypothetical protein
MPRALPAFLAALALALTFAACGDSSDPPAATADAPNNVITQAEADRHPRGSIERAFLEYWSALQYQSWAEVASYYDPAFRDFIGTAMIIGAKKINGSTYPQLKPALVEARPHPAFTTLDYSVQFLDGTRELASTSWRRSEGSWQMVYDSRLDEEMRQLAENRVEIAQNGTLPTDPAEVSPDATRAGAAAAQAQARFLQREFDLKRP